MKRLMLLWKEIASELGDRCCTSTIHDYNTVVKRSEHEGISFLTITLPAYGKAFEQALDVGKVDSDTFLGFKQGRGGLPLFLGGFLSRVFDLSTGVLLDEPDIDSIFALRQLTLMFGKILIPCSDARDRGAMKRFVECEQELEVNDESRPELAKSEFRSMCSLLYGNLLSGIDSDVDAGRIVPRHGPGATADRIRGNAKFDQRQWPQRLEACFPYGEWAIPNWRFYYLLDRVQFLESGAELPVRVITVPKTLKTPRIIAIEPTAMQYMQQGLLQLFVDAIERREVSNRFYADRLNVVHGMIGFTDQTPNQRLARLGSFDQELATLDLSEASDRVSNQHVLDMMRHHPSLSEAVQATRSRKADVLGHGILDLGKFASMGSALCFPMEAMVFLSVIFLGIQDGLGQKLTRRRILSFAGCVRVYGDDIIIPVRFVPFVLARLALYGFKTNLSKSFWNGKFRESCGKEFYAGEDVSISRVRRELPASRTDEPERIISAVGLRNHLYFNGLWRSARWMDNLLGSMLSHYPTVHPTSPVLGRHTVLDYEKGRVHDDTQAPMVKGFVVRSKPPISHISGEGALLKCLLKQGREPFADIEHLERQGRPSAVDIKLRWASPF